MNHIGFGAPSPKAVERIREKMKAAAGAAAAKVEGVKSVDNVLRVKPQ